MSFYSLPLLFASIVSAALGSSIYQRNKSETTNRIFFIYALSGAFISFTAFMSAKTGDYTAAYFWFKACFLWHFMQTLLFFFILAMTDNYTFIINKIILVLSFQIWSPTQLNSLIMKKRF